MPFERRMMLPSLKNSSGRPESRYGVFSRSPVAEVGRTSAFYVGRIRDRPEAAVR